MPPEQLLIDRDGVRLAYSDVGEGSPPVVLLHGLAGYAGEWSQTASWLKHHQVVALDARGHGASERCPADLSRSAQVADVAFVIEQLGLQPCVVVGQSMGGVTAMLLAAHRPELVAGLIVVEAVPMTPDDEVIERVDRWLAGWPVPFPTSADAVEFFGGPSLRAEIWAAGLETRDDGLWPQFEPEVMSRTLRECEAQTFWQEWGSITCPTLIVEGEEGSQPAGAAEGMLALCPGSRFAEVKGAGHDLHLERPDDWQALVESFIDSL